MFSIDVDAQLSLQLIHPNHADALFELIDQDREYLSQWLQWPGYVRSADDYRAFVTRSLHEHADQQTMVCVMLQSGQAVGTIGFVDLNFDLEKAELGYWLGQSFQGQGIVTRASTALIEIAFMQLGLSKIEATVAVGNHGSRAVCERLGMSLEGTIRQGEKLNGVFVDHAKYALFRTR